MTGNSNFNNRIIILLIGLFFFSFTGIVHGEKDLSTIHGRLDSTINASMIENVTGENVLTYQKNSYPVFIFSNDPLVFSLTASYSHNNIEYEKPFYSFSCEESDSNLYLAYTIIGKKYLGRNVNSGGNCIPIVFYEKQQCAPNPQCLRLYETLPNGTTYPIETFIHYATTVPELDEYMNNPSYEGQIFVYYSIINPKISKVSPIILNLGKWPISVNEEKIDDVLNKPIINDTILIFGSNTSMILNKGKDPNQIQFSIGTGKYEGKPQFVSSREINQNFSYVFYKQNGQYFLKVQKISGSQNGVLSLFFRPVKINYIIKIEDPLVENTLNFLDNSPERLRFKPHLQMNISNSEIKQIKFEYITNGNLKFSNIPLDQNGTYVFNEYLDADGNPFLYPFDHYTSRIIVDPPLLISNEVEIPTESNSGFDATLKINYKNVNFVFTRSFESVMTFLIGLMVVIIGLIFLLLKPEADVWLMLVSVAGVILATVSLLNANGLNHFFSIGSLLILISIILTITTCFYFLHRKNSKTKNS